MNGWLEATDANGCTATDEFEVNMMNVDQIIVEPVDICQGETTQLKAPPGFANYNWNTGESTQTIEVSPTDNFSYECVVSDGDCQQTIVFDVNVNEPDPFTLDNIFACENSIANANGPDGYDEYSWSYGGAQGKNLSFTATNDFTLELTAWKNGCAYTATSQVILVSPDKFDLKDKAICNGSSATYSVPSGWEEIQWSTGETSQSITLNPTQTTDYYVEVTDEYGCSYTDEFTVQVADFLSFDVADREICQGTQTNLFVQPGYSSYLWSTGQTTNEIEVSPLSDKTYTVTVTDANGCTGTQEAQVIVKDFIEFTLDNKEICPGEYTKIGINQSNDVYASYLWNDGSTTSEKSVSPSSTTNYTLTVEDDNGCQGQATAMVVVHDPDPISLDPITVCEDQEAQITAPVGNYTDHKWNGQDGTEQHTFTPSYHSTVNLSMRDQNGCRVTTSTNVYVNRKPRVNLSDQYLCKFEPTQIYLNQNYENIEWSDGTSGQSITLQALEDETVSVTVTDENGCQADETFQANVYDYTPISLDNQFVCQGEPVNISVDGNWVETHWSNGKSTSEITEYPVNTTDYSVLATDLNGCKVEASMTATVIDPEDFELPGIELCKNDTIQITAPAGQNYQWSTGETTQSIEYTANNSQLLSLKMVDQYGCEATAEKLAIVYPKPSLNLADGYTCKGNATTIKAAGGYTYQWSNGEISREIEVSPLEPTTYSVTITDGKGCTANASSFINVKDKPSLSLENHIVCPGEYITLDAGQGYYKYNWNNGVIGRYNTVQPTEDINYQVTVKDEFGCENIATSSILVNEVPTLEDQEIEVCQGDTITYQAETGFQSYQYSNGMSGQSISDVFSKYNKISLTATDANGCSRYGEIAITTLEKPSFNLPPNYYICQGQSKELSIIEGYRFYRWDDGVTGSTREVSPTTNTKYTVEVEDFKGCKTTKATTVNISTLNDIYLNDQMACFDDNLTFEIPDSAYKNITWSNGVLNTSKVNLKAKKDTIIKISVEDYYGCVDSAQASIFVNNDKDLNLEDIDVCKGETFTVIPGGVYDSYKWSTGHTSPVLTMKAKNDMRISLEVTDNQGCVKSDYFDVHVKQTPKIDFQRLDLCSNDSIVLGIPSKENHSYLWSTGDTTSLIKKAIYTDQQFILSATNNFTQCQLTDTLIVDIKEKSSLSLGNRFSEKGKDVILEIDNDSFENIQWSTGDTTKSIIVAPDSSTYYFCQAVDTSGCWVNDEILVYTSEGIYSAVQGDTTCPGENAYLKAARGFESYNWSTGETSSEIVVSNEKTTQYSVEITDRAGTKRKFNVRNVVKPGPTIPFGDTTVCPGSDLILTLSPGYSYQWSNGQTGNSAKWDSITNPFSYSVVAADNNECAREVNGFVDLFASSYKIKGLRETYSPGQALNLYLINSDKIQECHWDINGISYDKTEIQAYLYDAGKYEIKCEVIDKNGCSFTFIDSTTVSQKTDIPTYKNEYLFIYPNPTSDLLNIEVGDIKGYYTIDIISASGKSLMQEKSLKDNHSIDISSLPKGIYTLQVQTSNNIYNKLIIKN
jgi:hypothetical protein